jgi:hypothetical protein
MRHLFAEFEEIGDVRKIRVRADQTEMLVAPEAIARESARVFGRRTAWLLGVPLCATCHEQSFTNRRQRLTASRRL